MKFLKCSFFITKKSHLLSSFSRNRFQQNLIKTVCGLFIILVPHLSEAQHFKLKKWVTSNGARVIFYQTMEVPIVEFNIAFAAGSAYDGNKFGLSELTADLLNQGNGGLPADKIAEDLASTGAQYREENGRDMVILNLRSLIESKALQSAINNFHLIVTKPDFPTNALTRQKNQQLVAIAQNQESPEEVANITFFKGLYSDHPYGHPVLGLSQTVSSLTREDVINFYQRYFVGANAIIVIVGALNENQAHEISEALIKGLPTGQKAVNVPKAMAKIHSETIAINFPSSQTMLRLGQIGIDHHSSDYFPLNVGNYILGGGNLVSRLSEEVREKRGLTYGITSQFVPMPGEGPFVISLSTQNKQSQNALKLTKDVLTQFIAQGPTEEEVAAAKKYLTGSFSLSLGSNSNIANTLLRIAFFNLPEDYLETYINNINLVTREQITKAFQAKINLNNLLLVSVGKA